MRTLKDFTYGGYSFFNSFDTVGKIRYNQSCALESCTGLFSINTAGIQLAEFDTKTKVPTNQVYKYYDVKHKQIKQKNGKYLYIEYLSLKKGAKGCSGARKGAIRNEPDCLGNPVNAHYCVRMTYLEYVANQILKGGSQYNARTNNYEPVAKATEEELIAIKKEVRELIRGKDISLICRNTELERQLDLIKKVFGLFNKKPKLSFNFNNLVHPANHDYLTFQLYSY